MSLETFPAHPGLPQPTIAGEPEPIHEGGRRLRTLPRLMAVPSPDLEPLLLAEFGPGTWHAETWHVEPVWHDVHRGAELWYTVTARHAGTGRRSTQRFAVKVYHDDRGEQLYHLLAALRDRCEATGAGYTVGRPIAYRRDLHALVLAEASGASLDAIVLRGPAATVAVRHVARALAAFNQDHFATPRQYVLQDQIEDLYRSARLLQSAGPHLWAELEAIAGAVVAGLEEVPPILPGPTHRDLKTDQIYLDGDRVVFVALDALASADPVLDPALLLARLAARALAGGSAVPQRWAAVAEVFAEEYFELVPAAWRSRLPAHYAGALLAVAASGCRDQEPRWPEKVAPLLQEARDSLAGRIW